MVVDGWGCLWLWEFGGLGLRIGERGVSWGVVSLVEGGGRVNIPSVLSLRFS